MHNYRLSCGLEGYYFPGDEGGIKMSLLPMSNLVSGQVGI